MRSKGERIFWLGMHKVLVRTELPRLRQLGYEVFNPPYLSSVYDQSAMMEWDGQQESTLPKEAFDVLRETAFFYKPIPKRAADILNEYFGTVIVTINPDWLRAVCRCYHGRIIYCVYGQSWQISNNLQQRGLISRIQDNGDFHIVAHAEEAVAGEHDWVRERTRIVPYALVPEVFQYRDTWQSHTHERECMVNIPNIANPYYGDMYRRFSRSFPESHFRIYGVQPATVPDPRVIGTLDEEELHRTFQRKAGMFYPYQDPQVCYLPPIEMMTVGGPVIYADGSLLARYFEGGSPGLGRDVDEQKRKIGWLLDGDQAFIRDVIESQEPIRRRYSPEHVWPLFDAAFTEILKGQAHVPAPTIMLDSSTVSARKRVYILFHFPGGIVHHANGKYFSSEGIPRVVQKVVQALMAKTDYEIVITCRADQVYQTHGFFGASASGGRIKIMVLDPKALCDCPATFFRRAIGFGLRKARGLMRRVRNRSVHLTCRLRAFLVHHTPRGRWRVVPRAVGRGIKGIVKLLVAPIAFLHRGIQSGSTRSIVRMVEAINSDGNAAFVVVPHYYLFREAIQLRSSTVLYLPDYTPHFFKGVSFDPGRDSVNEATGRDIANRASAIFTNSEFTRSYLSDTALNVPADRVRAIPIPLLVGDQKAPTAEERSHLEEQIGNAPFIFYPTQNRPNKQIALLLEVFAEVLKVRPELRLVLTCSLDDWPEARAKFSELDMLSRRGQGGMVAGFADKIIFMRGVSDGVMGWLYEHASMLCLTSTMEGNFPPQVFEAITSNTAVVSTRLPMITEILNDDSDKLLLCDPMDKGGFVEKVLWALDHPEEVRRRQIIAHDRLMAHSSDERFQESLYAFLREFDLA